MAGTDFVLVIPQFYTLVTFKCSHKGQFSIRDGHSGNLEKKIVNSIDVLRKRILIFFFKISNPDFIFILRIHFSIWVPMRN